MSNSDPWGNQNRPLGQNFNRQHPPVLPPPSSLEPGSQMVNGQVHKFYPFPTLPSISNNFSIPSLNNDDRNPDRTKSGPLSSSMGLNDQGQQSAPSGAQPPTQQSPVVQHQVSQSQPQTQPQPPTQPQGSVSAHQSPVAQLSAIASHQSAMSAPGELNGQQLTSQQSPQTAQSTPTTVSVAPVSAQTTGQLGGEQSQEEQSANSISASAVQSAAEQVSQMTQQAPAMSQNVPNRSTTTNVYRPLNVKDALSYLDQVKIQFYNQADVYNNFLDIMKDFKSQSIDTPGVIGRVSTLFRGHPNLIQGFNTFLPPGYRIECSLDPSDPNPIRVTTPTGTTTAKPATWGEDVKPIGNIGEFEHAAQQASGLALTQAQTQAQSPNQIQQQPPADGNSDQMNHAITYVNKIKTRFANQPDIYKQFLEILQTYQREQKPIAEVYEQITVLFSNSPDLLDDFKQFLPDTSAAPVPPPQPAYNGTSQLPPVGNFQPPTGNGTLSPPIGGQFQPPHVVHGQYQHLPPPSQAYGQVLQPPAQLQQGQEFQVQQQLVSGPAGQLSQLGQISQGQLPPQSQVQPPQHLHGQNQPQSNHLPDVNSNGHVINDRQKKSISEGYNFEKNYNNEAQYSSMRSEIQPRIDSNTQVSTRNGVSTITNPTLVPGIPEPIPSSNIKMTSSLQEEIGFFDKVKKAIGNKQTYNDFLKILNLYSQDIIDKETLIDRVDSFVGDLNPELVNWFKMFVGWEEPEHIETILFKKHQLELSLCKAHGPSYRQLPKAETYMPCSGRDEMCWEVLNDEWVGHPTWASEDSGFIAHRKNQYEEILFRIEEERLEYDYNMEANLRTIQTLETIANRIANMTPEQKANFKLPPGLGHTSVTIYKKVIRKIYDKDRGFEVIDALHENPAIAVPIVLKRLKQKDEEWRRAQREWNKVWREMEQKVFHKSLDHLGLTFKQADKKLLTTKQLISEISTVKVEQQNKRLYPLTPKPQEQLIYKVQDFELLYDILRLSDVFITKSSNYSSNDREKLVQFFQFFVSLFFGISTEEIEEKLAIRKAEEPKVESNGSAEDKENTIEERVLNDSSDDSSTYSSSDSALMSSYSKKRARENDLLRDVLKKQSKSKKDEPETSPQTSESEEIDEIARSSELWISTTGRKFSLKDNEASLERREIFNLFCNTTVYVFFRHLTTLYQRLEEVKAMNEEIAKDIRARTAPQFAKDLNLINHQLADLNVEIFGDKDCYKQVLALSERLIEGELEHQWFEESVRQAYKNKAYKIYTIDKVVQALIKHMHSMITDSRTSEMMVAFETDRKTPVSTVKDQILYRMNVRSLMSSDENMFKIAYKEADKSVNIQFVGLDDLTINDHKTAEEHYNYYVTSYVMSHPTEGVPASKINMPFSKEFIEAIDEDQCVGHSNSELKVSICENSYRLFFEVDTHDEFTSNQVYDKPVEKSSTDKLSGLKKHLEDEEIGWKSTLNEDQKPHVDLYENKLGNLFGSGIEEYKAAVTEVAKAPESEKVPSPEPKEQEDVPMVDAEVEVKAPVEAGTETASEVKDEKKFDADTTVVQEHNDTTIQQDANDTTTDDNTVNESMIGGTGPQNEEK